MNRSILVLAVTSSVSITINSTLCAGNVAQAASLTMTDQDPVLYWNNATLNAISQSKIAPTSASRAIAITSTSMYDAWAAYDPQAIGTQLGDTLQVAIPHITEQNKQTAISYAAYRTLSNLFPSQQPRFDALMGELGYDQNLAAIELSIGTSEQSEAAIVGNKAAQAILNFRSADGSNQANNYADTTGYKPSNTWDKIREPDKWQPINVDGSNNIQKFSTPHWNQVTPFALDSSDQYLPPRPEPFLNERGNLNESFISQATDVIEYSAHLTDREKVIAEYWADGPQTVLPPGHWQLFGQYVSQRDNFSLDDNVKLFFGLGNAVFDASIASWDAKARYDYARPISAIRYLAENNLLPTDHPYVRVNENGKTEIYAWGGSERGAQWILGTDWLPYQDAAFLTPPFPEYISGHSTFSAAAAEVLLRFTGSDSFGLCHIAPADSSTFENDMPAQSIKLCWNTFTEAADEAGLSRLYGGIHFEDGDINGRAVGRLVGDSVWKKSQYYINGGSAIESKSVAEPRLIAAYLLGASLLMRYRKRS